MSDEERAVARQSGADQYRRVAAQLDAMSASAKKHAPPSHPTTSEVPGLWSEITHENPHKTSNLCLRVLPQLYGRPWDERAMNLVDALRPSRVRVSKGELKTNAITWRVTVMLDSEGHGVIKWIEQEVTVGLRGDFEHGHDYDVRYLRAPSFTHNFDPRSQWRGQ